MVKDETLLDKVERMNREPYNGREPLQLAKCPRCGMDDPFSPMRGQTYYCTNCMQPIFFGDTQIKKIDLRSHKNRFGDMLASATRTRKD